jgi:hypothetical protein
MFSSPVSIAHRGAAAARILDHPHADIDAVDPGHLRGERRLDRIRQVIIGAGLRVANIFAEPEHDTELVRLNEIDAGAHPEHEGQDRDQEDAPSAETAARHHRAELVLAPAQEFLEVGRRRTR